MCRRTSGRRGHDRPRPAEGPEPAGRLEAHARSWADRRRDRHRRGTPSSAPASVPGGDYVYTGDGTDDCDGHGTVVAGIIGAEPDSDGSRFSGVAPDATIIGIRQSSNKFRASDDPSGSGFGDVDTLAMAVRTAADMGATVINVSSVACLPTDAGLDDRPLGAALAYAVDVKNVVVVAAAGNVGGAGQCPEQNPRPIRLGRADRIGTGSASW